MAPCSRATLRLLTSILIASGTASVAALPLNEPLALEQVIAARQAEVSDVTATLPAGAEPTVASPDPSTFFEELMAFVAKYGAVDTFQDWFEGLLGAAEETETAPPVTYTLGTPTTRPFPTASGTMLTMPLATSAEGTGGMTIQPYPYPIETGGSMSILPISTSDVSAIPTPSANSTEGGMTIQPFPYPIESSSSLAPNVEFPTFYTSPISLPLLPTDTTPVCTEEPCFSILPIPTSLPLETGGPVITVTFTMPPGQTAMPEIRIIPYPSRLVNNTDIDTTTTIRSTSTTFLTKTVTPVPSWPPFHNTSTSDSLAPTVSFPIFYTSPLSPPYPYPTNSGTAPNVSFPIFYTSPNAPIPEPTPSATTTTIILLPSPTPGSNSSTPSNSTFDTATQFAPLRAICADETIETITLPLLTTFYGPNAYPSLDPQFPGCYPPSSNSSQALRAPGLLNCTILGAEVQACQKQGRKVLISVPASSLEEVAGDTDFGAPEDDTGPWGRYFGFGPTTDDAGRSETTNGEESIPIDGRVSNRMPNLFDPSHPPSAFALTLFSLFSEGQTERADLRPLGPLDGSKNWDDEDGIRWWSKPLGEEVVVDGFDVQVPSEWEGTVQEGLFDEFVWRLRELTNDAWVESGGVVGGEGDLGSDGPGVVVQGWV